MDKQIKLPAKFTQLDEFQARSLLYATREAMELRKNNKVNTRTIEGKCGLVFTFNFTDAAMCRLIGVRNERFNRK